MKALLLFLISTSTLAQEAIDQRLKTYIEEFNLTPQKKPEIKKENLWKLGRLLFHDRRLSGNNNIGCFDCHHTQAMTHDGLPLGVGEGATGIQSQYQRRLQKKGHVLARNTLALYNLHNVHVLFWDGRVEMELESKKIITPIKLQPEVAKTIKSALAAQALFPMVDHNEMRGQKGSNSIADAKDEYEAWDLITKKILSIPKYQTLFSETFPGEKINIGHLGEALAEFQGQNFFFADTPYDRYIQGEISALTDKQKIGMDVFFNKGKCGDCHNGEHLSALDFDGVASPQIGPGKQNGDDYGRYQWDKEEGSRFAFRVPPLRNVGLTAPYFHDGSMKKLEDVVKHYNDVFNSLDSFKILEQLSNYNEPIKDHDHTTNEERLMRLPADLPLKLYLTSEEIEALVDFMRYGLTDVRLQNKLKK